MEPAINVMRPAFGLRRLDAALQRGGLTPLVPINQSNVFLYGVSVLTKKWRRTEAVQINQAASSRRSPKSRR